MSRFADALKIVLVSEGGFSNDPADPGGVTEHGITQRVYDAFRAKLNLPLQSVVLILDGEVSMLYHDTYWIPARCDALPDPIDLLHFDAAVNSGVIAAGRMLQGVLNSIVVPTGTMPLVVDGHIGPKTLDAMTHAVARGQLFTVAMSYAKDRLVHYLAIGLDGEIKFIRGWLHRIANLTLNV